MYLLLIDVLWATSSFDVKFNVILDKIKPQLKESTMFFLIQEIVMLLLFSDGSPAKINKVDTKVITSEVNNKYCFI